MGLCKCPKRKVTNQFCFEHRVNVCEHCMVNSHKKCVVQSYLAWLQDSDFSPDCGFCRSNLAEEECVRLTCYCLYHWSCLDNHCRNLPPSTAPAGYTCTQCDAAIFPPDNLVSPVADQLRKLLQDVNWARAGLGLTLLPASAERKPGSTPVGPRPTPEGEDKSGDSASLAHEIPAGQVGGRGGGGGGWKGDAVVNFEASTSRRLNSESNLSSPLLRGDPDSDSNKYKRRGPTDFLFRWLRSITKPVAQRRRGGYCSIIIIILFIILSLAAIFSWFGRDGYEDPMLDPLNNPNIRIGDI